MTDLTGMVGKLALALGVAVVTVPVGTTKFCLLFDCED